MFTLEDKLAKLARNCLHIHSSSPNILDSYNPLITLASISIIYSHPINIFFIYYERQLTPRLYSICGPPTNMSLQQDS